MVPYRLGTAVLPVQVEPVERRQPGERGEWEGRQRVVAQVQGPQRRGEGGSVGGGGKGK